MSRSSTPTPCAPSSSSSTESSCGEAEPVLDLRGEVCPYTFVRTRLRLEEMPLGARLTILVDHEPAIRNIPRSARDWGQAVEQVEAAAEAGERDGRARAWRITLRKLVE
ncbi:sulfurtransferase TusA family protein [Haliangium sp.]|uniref:sulfurtransferase TusA family protein n=1 Tax=Haliangium sp. TaxID=2663208 RepID=UPI003D0CFDB5